MGAPNDYYVHATEGSDATGDGSIGNPFATHIGALAVLTQDSTNGDRINVIGDSVATATIAASLGTYGAPSEKAPLIFNGLTGGGLNGDGTYSVSGSYETTACIHYTNLRLHNCGDNNIVEVSSAAIINCEVDTNSGSGKYGIYLRAYCLATGCNVHGVDRGIYCYNENQVLYNYLADIAGSYGIINNSYSSHYLHNIICVSGSTTGIYTAQRGGIIANNSILSSGGTGRGIYITNYYSGKRIYNNLIEGFSGSGGDGIELDEVSNSTVQFLLANNAVYNCESAYTGLDYGDWIYNAGENETLSASPFAKKGDNTFANRFEYFRPLNVGNILSGGYPVGSRMFKGAVPPKFAVSVPHMIQAGIGVL